MVNKMTTDIVRLLDEEKGFLFAFDLQHGEGALETA
jgi:hypothetical protein